MISAYLAQEQRFESFKESIVLTNNIVHALQRASEAINMLYFQKEGC
jgi:hypothetical protein